MRSGTLVAITGGTRREDPGVQTGVFTYELHPCRGFPGDALPA